METEPSRKLESRARTRSSGLGYTTRIDSGARGGALGALGELCGAGATLRGAGACDDGGWVDESGLANPRIRAPRVNCTQSMIARYMVTMTYAKATLTLPGAIRRLSHPIDGKDFG